MHRRLALFAALALAACSPKPVELTPDQAAERLDAWLMSPEASHAMAQQKCADVAACEGLDNPYILIKQAEPIEYGEFIHALAESAAPDGSAPPDTAERVSAYMAGAEARAARLVDDPDAVVLLDALAERITTMHDVHPPLCVTMLTGRAMADPSPDAQRRLYTPERWRLNNETFRRAAATRQRIAAGALHPAVATQQQVADALRPYFAALSPADAAVLARLNDRAVEPAPGDDLAACGIGLSLVDFIRRQPPDVAGALIRGLNAMSSDSSPEPSPRGSAAPT
jgi:hypothetical protein